LQDVLLRNRTRCYGPISHKKAGRGARERTWANVKAGNMSASTYMRKEGADEP